MSGNGPMRKSRRFRVPAGPHGRAYLANREAMIARGREVNPMAFQHRHFKVSAVVLAYKAEYDHPTHPFYRVAWNLFTGVNLMPIKGGPKVCAEMAAISAARAAGYQHIVAVCVVGEKQNDDVSQVETATLHPCWSCRTMMEKLPEITPDSIILTIRTNQNVGEEQTFAQLLDKHRNGNGTPPA